MIRSQYLQKCLFFLSFEFLVERLVMINSPYFQRHLFFLYLLVKRSLMMSYYDIFRNVFFFNFRFVSKTFGNDISL
jgi:hypothetical protein